MYLSLLKDSVVGSLVYQAMCPSEKKTQCSSESLFFEGIIAKYLVVILLKNISIAIRKIEIPWGSIFVIERCKKRHANIFIVPKLTHKGIV